MNKRTKWVTKRSPELIVTSAYVEKTLKIAEITENHFAEWLSDRGWEVLEITQGVFSEYDIKVTKDGITLTFEVKTASASERYGCYFVEYYQSGKRSGMLKTTADYQVYYDERGDVRMFQTQGLDDYIINNDLPIKPTKYKTISGNVSALGYTVPYEAFTFVTNHDLEIRPESV